MHHHHSIVDPPRLLQPRLLLTLVAFLALQPLTGWSGPRPHYRITDLGPVPYVNSLNNMALNNHGHVVGLLETTNGVNRPALYRDGTVTALPFGNENAGGFGFDINDAGEIIGQADVGLRRFAYLVTAHGLINLTEQTGREIEPANINNSGVIAANIYEGFNIEAATWKAGVLRPLRSLSPGYALGINNRGDVLLNYYDETIPGPGPVTALVHPNDTVTIVGAFSGWALNDRRMVAGHFAGFACVHRFGRLHTLGALPGDVYSYAKGINLAGQIIGDSEDNDDRTRPFLYTAGQMHDPNKLIPRHSGWTIANVSDINDRGQMVGTGWYQGQSRGFLLSPPRLLRPHKNK